MCDTLFRVVFTSIDVLIIFRKQPAIICRASNEYFLHPHCFVVFLVLMLFMYAIDYDITPIVYGISVLMTANIFESNFLPNLNITAFEFLPA
jgi:hypothetical protein